MFRNWDASVNIERLHQGSYNSAHIFLTIYHPWIDEHPTRIIQVEIDRRGHLGLTLLGKTTKNLLPQSKHTLIKDNLIGNMM